ncbi:plant UBX domain-containing protein 10-like [Alnus glutinosa]|uniref:plant UBX domain-containing protein 10-like n=1 Tax=Alnus glutinosa TaxID=3517 RepID=UPI002D768186|nr:plant UBX domain-containing protein 10-like [Alnus glutinosa]
MASMLRENRRSSAGEASRNIGIVRRMVSLPRNILDGFSRVMGIGRRNQRLLPYNFQLQHPEDDQPITGSEEWAFLGNLEQQYGSYHPFFYACQFMETLKLAEEDRKFMFMYLHSPEHPFTPSFCRETLCSEVVVQFLDANFVCWGALANRGEGLQMSATFRPTTFPFCAVIAPAPGDSIAVLRQMEGPISPAELVETLQRTVEEQGLAFGGARAKQEEKIKADRRLREEQDAAYLASLQIDKEKEKLRNNHKQYGKVKEGANITTETTQYKEVANGGKDSQAIYTQILIRFPNGERREQSFASTEKVQSIYRYIDSLGLPGIGNYRLVSSFPRKVYGVDQMGMTLKDSGLHPRGSLFLEPL